MPYVACIAPAHLSHDQTRARNAEGLKPMATGSTQGCKGLLIALHVVRILLAFLCYSALTLKSASVGMHVAVELNSKKLTPV